jgi:4-diphosphocytidyl-2-C-methyl-D-erythritol kinase
MRRFRSCAKLNLHLEVVGRRDDGFHELRTIFQTIDLADEIELEPLATGGEVRLEVFGADLPTDERNLAVRAARAFLDAWGRPGEGVAIRLRKRIPAGAGLGGGSANAATVLEGMGVVFDRTPDAGWLRTAASRLGADVSFFLVGGTAIGLGRGDRLIALADPPGGAGELWLAIPPYPLSTAAVYAAFVAPPHEPPPRPPLAGLLAGSSPAGWPELIGNNDLEHAAFALRPELGALYTALASSGARRIRLSGSGSTLFALYDDPVAARRATRALPPGTAWQRVSTLGREAWRAACGLPPSDGEG